MPIILADCSRIHAAFISAWIPAVRTRPDRYYLAGETAKDRKYRNVYNVLYRVSIVVHERARRSFPRARLSPA